MPNQIGYNKIVMVTFNIQASLREHWVLLFENK